MSARLFVGPFKGVPRDVRRGESIAVQVLSRHCIESGRGYHDEPYAFISVTEPQNYHAPVRECENRRGYLPLHFHDVPHDLENRSKHYVTITEDQSDQLAGFVLEMVGQGVRLFVINCEAGISRSAAIGAALWGHFNGDPSVFFSDYCPNRTVYERVRKALKESA